MIRTCVLRFFSIWVLSSVCAEVTVTLLLLYVSQQFTYIIQTSSVKCLCANPIRSLKVLNQVCFICYLDHLLLDVTGFKLLVQLQHKLLLIVYSPIMLLLVITALLIENRCKSSFSAHSFRYNDVLPGQICDYYNQNKHVYIFYKNIPMFTDNQ